MPVVQRDVVGLVADKDKKLRGSVAGIRADENGKQVAIVHFRVGNDIVELTAPNDDSFFVLLPSRGFDAGGRRKSRTRRTRRRTTK